MATYQNTFCSTFNVTNLLLFLVGSLSQRVTSSLFFFLIFFFLAVGGVTARGQPSAAQGPVVHVSLPGARRRRSLPAPEPHPAAGQQQLLHHHHPADRLVSCLLIGLWQAAGCVQV